MMEIAPFHVEHLEALAAAGASMLVKPLLDNPEGAASLTQGQNRAFTGMVDGQAICCGGIVHQWEGRAICWAMMTKATGPHMLAITRGIRAFLAEQPYRRIEFYVDMRDENSQRWHRMLGARCEGVMQCFSPDGRDFYMYARVRGRS